MAFTPHPLTATTISSSDMARHLDDLASFRNRWVSGYAETHSAVSLNVTIDTGVAIIGGRRVGVATDASVVAALQPSDTNHLFLKSDGTLFVDQTGAGPSGESFKLYEFVTDGSGVTSVVDFRVDDVGIDATLNVEKVVADGSDPGLVGGYALLEQTQPYLRFKDGANIKRLWFRSNKIQVTDDAGATLTDDLGNITLTGTAGSIFFAGATGSATEDNANLFWDNTNNRLGIGTATPQFTIDIAGQVRIRSANALSFGGTGAADNDVSLSRGAADRLDLASGDSLLIATDGSTGALKFGAAADVGLFRGAADRLDLATGDSFNIVSGSFLIGDTAVFESDRDLAVSLIPNANNTLALGSTTRNFSGLFISFAEGSVPYIGASGQLSQNNLALNWDNANKKLQLGDGTTLDVTLYRSAANVLKTDDSLTVAIDLDVTGTVKIGATTVFEADRDFAIDLLPNADNALDLGSAAKRFAEVNGVIVQVFAAASDANPIVKLSSNTIEMGAGGASAVDVRLFRGAADRMDLATGDSFNLVSGSLIFVAGANQAALSRGANDRLDLASGDSFNIVSGSLLFAATAVIDSSRNLVGINAVAQALSPDATGTRDLGTTSLKYRDVFAVKVKGLSDGAATGEAIVYGQAAGGDLGGTYPNPTVPAAASYANKDTSAVPGTGDILWQGPILAVSANPSNNGGATLPGAISINHTSGTTPRRFFLTGPFSAEAAGNSAGVPLGTKFYAKGIYKEHADTRLATTHEKFAVGVIFAADNVDTTVFANQTETTRDDRATVAVVVDATDESIQSYNTAEAGNAAYTDSTFDAALASGTEFEIIVEVPTGANSDDDVLVTIKIRDSGGTMRTIFSAAVPASTSATANRAVFPIILINQAATVYNLFGKLEKAA
jgi:hypothetical protein